MAKAHTLILILLLVPSLAVGQEVAPVVPDVPQETPPSGLARMEEARSRSCVGVMARLDTLDAALAPLARRSERLMAIGQAIQLEERSVVDSLRTSDPTEAAVRAWFASDLALAQQYVESRDESLVAQRRTARERILTMLADTATSVQARAQALIQEAGDAPAAAGTCDGAILVRPVVVEECAGLDTPLCQAARQSEPSQRYRFVPTAEDLWGVSEFRPWTNPTPLQVGPDGQIAGARTVGYARQGNIVLTLAFSPLLQQRENVPPQQLARIDAIVDSLGFDFQHPSVVFAPALGLRTYLPEPLAGESTYVLHFGSAEGAVALWTGPAGTGEPIDVTVAMGPAYATALASGAPVYFTAIAEADDGTQETVFSVAFTAVNQTRATQALLGYMSGQLSQDVNRLIPPEGG